MEGWIKLYRQMHDSRFTRFTPANPACKAWAWVDLLLLANHADNKMYDGRTLKRGQLQRSVKWLCLRWGWSKTKTLSFLNRSESESEIIRQSGPLGTVITIYNYELYQGAQEKVSPQVSPSKVHSESTESPLKDPNNKNKNVKRKEEEKKEPSAPPPISVKPVPIPYEEIISDLNLVLGKTGNSGFKPTTKAYRDRIASLWKEYDLEDFKHVHRIKVEEWTGTEYAKYLNPDTLYAASKFPKYAVQEQAPQHLHQEDRDYINLMANLKKRQAL